MHPLKTRRKPRRNVLRELLPKGVLARAGLVPLRGSYVLWLSARKKSAPALYGKRNPPLQALAVPTRHLRAPQHPKVEIHTPALPSLPRSLRLLYDTGRL